MQLLKNSLSIAMKFLLPVFLIILFSCKNDNYFVKSAVFPENATISEKIEIASGIVPDKRQLAWQKLEMTAFLHFGINTFTGREWGEGTESPLLFNPTKLDARQWAKTVKEGGFKMMILTAKHHDGFCLWPTSTTTHSVASSPWRDGKGDVVREVSDACREFDLKFGVYLSPWDRNAKSYGNTPEYNRFFMAQLTELLTNYGKVDEVWFDGACGEGPNGKKQEYDWEAWYALIKKLQPEAVIAIKGEDVRWVGTETGYGRPTEWSVTALAPGGRKEMIEINEALGLTEMSPDLGSREVISKAKSLYWYPAEVDVSIRPGWFFHEEENDRVKTLARLTDIYFNSVGMNAVLLLNIPPDKRGLIHENDAERLKEFNNWIKNSFSANLLKNALTDTKDHSRLIDDNEDSYITLPDFPSKITFTFDEPKNFNVIELKEYIEKGQRVESFYVEANTGKSWQKIAEGTTIGYRRLIKFPDIKAQAIRFTITASRNQAFLESAGVYLSQEVLSDPVIRRNKAGMLSIDCEVPGPLITFTTDGADPGPESQVYVSPVAFPDGGLVKARAFLSDFSKTGDIVSENFGISPAHWKVTAFSAETKAFPAEAIIDGDASSMWHTPWEGNIISHPHFIEVDMSVNQDIAGFIYRPRKDGNFSGTALTCSIEVSTNGKKWTSIVQNYSFDNMKNNPSDRKILLKKPVTARFFRFISHESIFKEQWSSAGEIEVIPAKK